MEREWSAAELAGGLAEHAWLIGNWTVTEKQGQAVFEVEGVDNPSTLYSVSRKYRVIVEEVDEP